MKLKILNKNNLINKELGLNEKYLLNNLIEFNTVEGEVYTENKNDTLDSFTIKINHLTEKIDIEPYDEVLCYYDDKVLPDKYMLVDTFNETMVSVFPKIYNYEISLFSKTKLLEGIVLPNKSITIQEDENPTVYDYVQQYLDEFLPKKRVKYGENGFVYDNILTLSERAILKLQSIKCAEKQWNTPTLREVLNDLFMLGDCIPVVKQNEIDYLDLTEKKNNITDLAGINYIQRNQSSIDYLSEIYMNMQNVMNTKTNGIKKTTTTTEFLPFVSNDYTMTSENFILKTNNPILRIKKFIMYNYVVFKSNSTPLDNGYILQKHDLNNLKDNEEDVESYSVIKEYDDYNSLKVAYRSGDISKTPIIIDAEQNTADIISKSEMSKWQNTCIYYKRNSNEISGFTTETKNAKFLWWETGVKNVIDLYKENFKYDVQAPYRGGLEGGLSIDTPQTKQNQIQVLFEIEYETISDAVFQAGKSFNKNNDRVIIDNQTNSFVDSVSQGNLEYQKADRLGNPLLIINQRVKKGEKKIEISDFYNDGDDEYIVYKTEYQIYKNYVSVNAYATKDFILRDYFTGIKNKVRTWVNAKTEAFESHNLQKIYCELSYNEKIDRIIARDIDKMSFSIHTLNPLNFISSILTNDIKTINHAIIRTHKDSNSYPSLSKLYIVDLIIRFVGKSLIFTVSFNDNYVVGKSFDYSIMENYIAPAFRNSISDNINAPYLRDKYFTDPDPDLAGILLKNNKYVNEKGLYDKIEIYIGNENDVITDLIKNANTRSLVFNNYIVRKNGNRCYLVDSNIDPLHGDTSLNGSYFRVIYNNVLYSGTVDNNEYYFVDENANAKVGDPVYVFPCTNDIIKTDGTVDDESLTDKLTNAFKIAMQRPIVNFTDYDKQIGYTVNKKKDNREIPRNTLQFEFSTDTKDLYFTQSFIENLQFIREVDNGSILVYIDSKENYIYNSNEVPTTSHLSTIVNSGSGGGDYVSTPSVHFDFTLNENLKNKCFYIVKNNKVLIGGLTKSTTNKFELYLNLKYTRRDYIYNNDNIIVGSI